MKIFVPDFIERASRGGRIKILEVKLSALKSELRIGIMEADIDSDVDAHKIRLPHFNWPKLVSVVPENINI